VIDTVVAVTLSVEFDQKLESDLQRLKQTTQFRTIVYCTSRPLTEEALEKAIAKIRRLSGADKSVQTFGQVQLVDLALRPEHEGLVRHHYHSEIHNIEQTLLAEPSLEQSPETIGLRLALLTQIGDDAKSLRAELSKRLVLECLYPDHQMTIAAIASGISRQLHLPRNMSEGYVREIASRLQREGLIDQIGVNAHLTDLGRAFISTVPTEASAKLLEGRVAVKEAIRELSGHDLHEDQFERLWGALQDGLARLFYSHGLDIVNLIRAVIEGKRAVAKGGESLLEELANSIGALFSSPQQGEEVRQAIIDTFSEKMSRAFAWLTDVAAVYVMMCALGLEGLSGEEVEKTLSSFQLVVDSDIIISLLSEGESNHAEIIRLVGNWRALGGKLLMTKPVLEEVAHHAWISEHDYKATNPLFDRMSEGDAGHLIENAFVRGFFTYYKSGKAHRRDWYSYIGQYRGRNDADYSKIAQILRNQYGFEVLSEAGEESQPFISAVERVLIQIASEDAQCEPEYLDRKARGKCARDGALFGAVRSVRDFATRLGHRQTTFILSSARLLREAEAQFRDELGEPNVVLSAAAVGALLTLVPGVRMGLGSLRGILFDTRLASSLTPVQRYAYRLLAGSTEYSVPWAQRVTLQRELGERLVADARAVGVPTKKLREKLLKSEDPEYSARIVIEALDRMAVTPETQQQVQKLRREVEKLREELRVRH
jgi:hypothetical protein